MFLFTALIVTSAVGALTSPDVRGWEQINGTLNETRCGPGTPWWFYFQPGPQPDKLVVFFQEGGACWDAESCKIPLWRPKMRPPPKDHVFFNRSISINPVAEWSYLFIPYCTGDAHLGTQTKEFSSKEKMYFWGRKNFEYALRWLKKLTTPTKILTAGCSAGSIGSYLNIHISKTHFPQARHYHWGDSFLPIIGENAYNDAWGAWPFSAALPDDFNKTLFSKWTANTSVELFSALQVAYNISYHSSAHNDDIVESTFYLIGGAGAGLSWPRYANKTLNGIHQISPEFSTFMFPGEGHCIYCHPAFLDIECEGWHLNTWMEAWLNDKPYPKVIWCSEDNDQITHNPQIPLMCF